MEVEAEARREHSELTADETGVRVMRHGKVGSDAYGAGTLPASPYPQNPKSVQT